MLTHFEVENLRCFRRRATIPLAPLTFIYGANNAGKSTLVRFLASLSQRSGRNLSSDGAGSLVNLGPPASLLPDHQESESLTIRLSYSDPGYPSPLSVEGSFRLDDVGAGSSFRPQKYQVFADNRDSPVVTITPHDYVRDGASYDADFKVQIDERLLNLGGAQASGFLNRLEVVRSGENVHSTGEMSEFINSLIGFHRQQVFDQEVELPDYPPVMDMLRAMFEHDSMGIAYASPEGIVLPPTLGSLAPVLAHWGCGGSADRRLPYLPWELPSTIAQQLHALMERMFYIGPLRTPPDGMVTKSESPPSSVGRKGEMTPELLRRNPDLIEACNEWLDALELGVRISVQEQEGHLLVRVAEVGRTPPVMMKLTDVGCGIMQTLPILAESLYQKGSMILIEQPELHIHPRLQAELGEFFVHRIGEPSVDRNHFVIETHSEHLLLRIRKKIRTGQLDPKMVQVLYVAKDADGSVVTPIGIDSDGQFKDSWPDGFFPERLNELLGD